MEQKDLLQLLYALKEGRTEPEAALQQLKGWPFEDVGFAKVDHHRSLTQGFPEVIFGLGKTPDQIALIMERLAQKNHPVLATRCTEEAYFRVKEALPDASYHSLARAITWKVPADNPASPLGKIAVVSAGTADLPVAEEAVISGRAMGCAVIPIYDVGVAGLHRLLAHRDIFSQVQAIIVTAGMEGALASVVAGMVDIPVIAVPTSIGYGASFGGLAALLGMLNSCALGVGVVNIDNGFGAAALAATIVRSCNR